jgi:hypothetical protein
MISHSVLFLIKKPSYLPAFFDIAFPFLMSNSSKLQPATVNLSVINITKLITNSYDKVESQIERSEYKQRNEMISMGVYRSQIFQIKTEIEVNMVIKLSVK